MTDNNSKVIILAAGEGIRLRPLTLDKPKCLIEIFGKKLLPVIKKEKYEDFKFPYQGTGSALNSEELYSIDFSFKDNMPHKFYLP